MISRENHRYLKNLKREKFNEWLIQFGFTNYLDGKKDTQAAIYHILIDKFNFTNEDIAKLKEGVRNDIESINDRDVTADEIINGLFSEGYKNVKGE